MFSSDFPGLMEFGLMLLCTCDVQGVSGDIAWRLAPARVLARVRL